MKRSKTPGQPSSERGLEVGMHPGLAVTNVRGSCMRASASSHASFRSLREVEDTQGLQSCSQQVPNSGRSSLYARSQAASICAMLHASRQRRQACIHTRLVLTLRPHAWYVRVLGQIGNLAHRKSCSRRRCRHCLGFRGH